jgi:hypothetical protein
MKIKYSIEEISLLQLLARSAWHRQLQKHLDVNHDPNFLHWTRAIFAGIPWECWQQWRNRR